jgi:hypothetical protein
MVILGVIPVLVSGALQLSAGALLVALFVYCSRWTISRRVAWQIAQLPHNLKDSLIWYIMRERRWVRLFRAFVSWRHFLKSLVLGTRLLRYLRVAYVFAEDAFLTGCWYFYVFRGYADDLLEDFMEYWEDCYHEIYNIRFSHWYFFYIFREQALYYGVAHCIQHGPLVGNVHRLKKV